jgi:Activator of Hsp90 ATPase homolog 1-like protein
MRLRTRTDGGANMGRDMGREFEVRWEGELAASPQEVWDAITIHTSGWLWPIDYEPWVGGSERGLTGAGTVTVWNPPRRFTTRGPDGDGHNQLDYRLEPCGGGTLLRYTHTGVLTGDYDLELDACRRHTAFYYHSLGEYLRHFSGRDAVHVSAEGPETSAVGGTAVLRRALGLTEDLAVGRHVVLRPAGLEPVEGVVDHLTPAFLGVRSADALYRFYGRDEWGWPVGLAHHLFADGVEHDEADRTWSMWLNGVLTEEVAV